ncbi:MAG: UDP-N-acetylmuramoyl-L-alanine--D-glutamate ligase [Holophagales bacterium]|jgi:UDP-N-acetylmuramoylalanine--D-glutamate ligase|nr:UDP-N-acetylmuramoyl-L-alanine--D-glutamate ligase [Holophagales bacterium]
MNPVPVSEIILAPHPGANHTIIVGAGKSGLAVARHLANVNRPVVLTDNNPSPGPELLARLASWGVPGVWGGHPVSLLDMAAEVVLSPVVNPKIPFVREAAQRGIPVIGELEFAHRVLRQKDTGALVLAITGTNGKSTATDLTAHILKTAGLPAFACGNLGFPFLDAVDGAGSGARFALECSSYQLETIVDFRAEAAAILNLTPDHLARHGAMDAYLKAKLRIFERQSHKDVCIAPANADFLSGFSPAGQCARFGWGRVEGRGAWCGADGQLYIRDAVGAIASVLNRSELLIPGDHNVENALAAILLAMHGGAPIEAVRRGLKSYPGLAHRLAFCGEKGGIKAYNDSKGTNVDATLTAIRALPGPLVLLLGGEDKGSGYKLLRDALTGKLRHLVFLGDAIPMLERDLGDLPHFTHKSFDEAVNRALTSAEPGDQILLSPACASFDQFKNFEERGEAFESLIREWMA